MCGSHQSPGSVSGSQNIQSGIIAVFITRNVLLDWTRWLQCSAGNLCKDKVSAGAGDAPSICMTMSPATLLLTTLTLMCSLTIMTGSDGDVCN